jgi:hypothetical protein
MLHSKCLFNPDHFYTLLLSQFIELIQHFHYTIRPIDTFNMQFGFLEFNNS